MANKRKKANETSETISGPTLDAFFGLKPDLVQDRKEEIAETASDIHTINLESKATIRVIYGLDQSTAQRFSTKASCSSQECREPLLNCLLNGSVKFQGSSMIDWLDLESLYGHRGKPREEDNYLTNFVIEAYLQLIANTSHSKGLKIETLGWEAFEKGFGNKPMKDLLKGKALLTEQDAVLVPCNPGLSKHWFLLVVLPKEKRVLVLDSKAGSFTKPSAENATAKMWTLLQQVDSSCSFQEKRPLLNASVYSTAERYNGNVTRLCSKIDYITHTHSIAHSTHMHTRSFHTSLCKLNTRNFSEANNKESKNKQNSSFAVH